jgi:hypothetical protein
MSPVGGVGIEPPARGLRLPRSFPAYLGNGLLHVLAEVYVPWDRLSCPRAAVKALESAVDEQRIVWVEGAHIPQSISVTPAAPKGVAVAR